MIRRRRKRRRRRTRPRRTSPVAIICLKSFLLFALKLRKIKIMFLTPAEPLPLSLSLQQLSLRKAFPVHHVSLCLSWSQPPFHLPPLLPLSSICPECHNFYVKASRMSFITPLSPPPTCPSSGSFIRLSSMKKICATNLRPLCNGRRQAGACTLPHFMTVFSLLLPPAPFAPPTMCVCFFGAQSIFIAQLAYAKRVA